MWACNPTSSGRLTGATTARPLPPVSSDGPERYRAPPVEVRVGVRLDPQARRAAAAGAYHAAHPATRRQPISSRLSATTRNACIDRRLANRGPYCCREMSAPLEISAGGVQPPLSDIGPVQRTPAAAALRAQCALAAEHTATRG
jgi:hypothetical protein